MKQIRCISNSNIENFLTVGKIYSVIPQHSKVGYVVTSDTGEVRLFLRRRFKEVNKKKKKPPVRKKTDVIVTYSNGKQYTLREVSYVCVEGSSCHITVDSKRTPGVTSSYSLTGIIKVKIMAPKSTAELFRSDVEGWNININQHWTISSIYTWSK